MKRSLPPGGLIVVSRTVTQAPASGTFPKFGPRKRIAVAEEAAAFSADWARATSPHAQTIRNNPNILRILCLPKAEPFLFRGRNVEAERGLREEKRLNLFTGWQGCVYLKAGLKPLW